MYRWSPYHVIMKNLMKTTKSLSQYILRPITTGKGSSQYVLGIFYWAIPFFKHTGELLQSGINLRFSRISTKTRLKFKGSCPKREKNFSHILPVVSIKKIDFQGERNGFCCTENGFCCTENARVVERS